MNSLLESIVKTELSLSVLGNLMLKVSLESIVKTELSLSTSALFSAISRLESIVKTELSLSHCVTGNQDKGLRVL